MPEQVQNILNQILEWWKKFTTTQKAILVSAVSVVLIALIILAMVVTKPEYTVFYEAANTADAAEVKKILDGESGIDYKISEDGLTFEVNVNDQSTAVLLLGENGYPSKGFTINDVTDGSFSTTSADKEKKYKEFLADKFASHIKTLEMVDDAVVDLDIPVDDGTILSKNEQSSASVMLTLNSPMDEDQAFGLAKFIATELGNDTTDKITIMDSSCNVLYSGSDSSTSVGVASTQLSYQQKMQNNIEANVKNALAESKVFTGIEVALNLSVDFSTTETVTHTYWPQEGSDVGLISTIDTYSSASVGGSAAVPGTDSNDNTSYMIQDNETTSSTIDESSIAYDNNEQIVTKKDNGGSIDYDKSSVSIVANRYVKYDEDILKANGTLGDMTFEEYQAANSQPVLSTLDESWSEVIANATGIDQSKITIVCYDVPMWVPSEGGLFTLENILQIALAVLIFALLGFVVFKSTRTNQEEEQEPELSVETLLETTAEAESLEDIGYNEKSEARLLIEKFVDENPDAVALLLRNWLNEDWE